MAYFDNKAFSRLARHSGVSVKGRANGAYGRGRGVDGVIGRRCSDEWVCLYDCLGMFVCEKNRKVRKRE